MSKVGFAEPLFRHPQESMCYLTETPYPVAEGVVSWVSCQLGPDSAQGALHCYDIVRQQNRTWMLPGRVGFAIPTTEEGVFLVGCDTTLALYSTTSEQLQVLCDIAEYEPEGTTVNHGIVFEDAVIFGSKVVGGGAEKAGLYLWRQPVGERGATKNFQAGLTQLRDRQSISNGKAVRKDTTAGKQTLTLLDIDSPTKKLLAYPLDLEAGQLGEPTTVLDFNHESAVPDGALLLDNQRQILISMYEFEELPFGETRLYDLTTAELLETWRTPNAPRNTCPTIVPLEAESILVLTTAMSEKQLDVPKEEDTSIVESEPLGAGGLFFRAVTLEAQGMTPRFALATR